MSWLHRPWHEQAARMPHHPAVVVGESTMTYGELHRAALALAAVLPEPDGPRPLAAVLGSKGVHTVIGVLGALCAGYGYVGLDAGQPAARLETMLRLTQPRVVITTGVAWRLAGELERVRWSPQRVVDLGGDLKPEAFADAGRTMPGEVPPAASPKPVAPDDTAYVLFTSGSTGAPKGVCVSHGAASAAVEGLLRVAPLTADDRVANQAPLSFDLSMFDLFSALGSGAALLPLPATAASLPDRLLNLLERSGATSLLCVPSTMRHLLEGGTWEMRRLALRRLCFSGEPLAPELLERIFATLGTDLEVWNFYGGTEMPWVFARRVSPGALDRANRFRPGDVPYRLIPLEGEAAPPRPRGELEVHGQCLLQGYLEPPDGLFRPRPPGAGHRTGDLASEGADGTVRLLGRVDRQAKVRGHRVDLDGVEHVLERHPRVSAAVVLPAPAGGRLVAFVAPSGGQGSSAGAPGRPGGGALRRELESHCQALLSPAMCPGEVRFLTTLPRTASGKKDRQRLAANLEDGAALNVETALGGGGKGG